MAEDYAQPAEEYKVWTSIKLPWPERPSKFGKRTTRGHDFWPTALSELFQDGQQTVEQQLDVGSKRACIVLSDDDTPQRLRVQVRRTVRVRRDGGASPVASGAVGPRVGRVDPAARTGRSGSGVVQQAAGSDQPPAKQRRQCWLDFWGGCWC